MPEIRAQPPDAGGTWNLTSGPGPPAPAAPPPRQTPWGAVPGPGPLLEPEYAKAVHAYRANPAPETADPLLKALRPVLDEGLKSYAGAEAQSPTLRAHAKRLALEAVRRYDPDRAKLRTHLLSYLRGLRRVSERATAPVYVPEQRRIDSQRVDRAAADLNDELGRHASDAELADRTALPLARVRRARAVPGVLAGSQTDDGPVPLSTPSERAYHAWLNAIYVDLDPVSQVILEHSAGLHGKPVLPAQVIAKMVGLSPGAVSQRLAKIQQQVDQFDLFMGTTTR